ncbi:transcriptional coactivator p15/PC4 family protein [Luminiphilus sp.]|nr:transcriptional coactivator p15/PC4 family protein [Luminiphilus sp.]
MSDSDALVLSEGGPKNKLLRISLQEFQGHPLLQIRYFYEDKQGDVKPTSKGIAIPKNRYLDLAEVIQHHHEDIADFLDGGRLNGEALDSLSSLRAQQARKTSSVVRIFLELVSGRKSELSNIAFEGATAKVKLNSNHGFFPSADTETVELTSLSKVLVALELAAMFVSSEESYEVQHTVDRLLHEFNRQLAKISAADIVER